MVKSNNINELSEEKLALLIPVGTGFGGTEEGADNLAYGLLYLIKDQNPDRIVFFTTELSNKTTLKSLKRQYKEEFNKELSKISTFIRIRDIDNFTEFYSKINNQIKDLKKYHVKIDYTSGTKTMTMAACIAATMNNIELMFVSGQRGKHNIVEKGTETLKIQSLNRVHEDQIFEDTEELFNQYRFKQGIDKLDTLNIPENDENVAKKKGAYLMLLATYNYWDEFNHKVAKEAFMNLDKKFNNPQMTNNKKALKIINDDNNRLQNYYLLASIINNARRRAEEGKYDDAIARLYRSMEFIGYITLNQYGIDPNNVDIEKVKEKSEYAYSKISGRLNRGHNGTMKMPGIDSIYLLIHNLNEFNEVGKFYYNHRTDYLEVLQHRNQSILAHGLEMKDEDDYNDFEKGVLALAIKLDENFEEYLKVTQFPKFDV